MEKSDIELINILVSRDIELTKNAIALMCTNKHIKYAAKLVEKAGLDPNEFPEMVNRLKKVSMRYFISSGDIGMYSLADVVSDDPDLLAILIEDLEFKYTKKNIEWMGPLAADLFRLYPQVSSVFKLETIEKITRIKARTTNFTDRFEPLQPEFCMSINIPLENVKFIDEESQLSDLVFSGNYCGLDCEWKPSMVKFNDTKVALLQMAFEDVVYLIDMIRLNTSPILNERLSELFFNPNIVKLGINFAGDKKNVIKSYPHMTAFQTEFRPYVELLDFYTNMYGESPGGLAGLSELVHGKTICKGEQMSNWERRPLRLTQMHYAALDAFVLIDIYKTLKSISENGTIDNKPFIKVEKPCDNCNSKLHMRKQCTRGLKCQICQLFGHIARDCTY